VATGTLASIARIGDPRAQENGEGEGGEGEGGEGDAASTFEAQVLLSCAGFEVKSCAERAGEVANGLTELPHLQVGGPLRTKTWIIAQVEKYGDGLSLPMEAILRLFQEAIASEATWGIAGQNDRYFILLHKSNTVRFAPPPVPNYNIMTYSIAGAAGPQRTKERIGQVVQSWLSLTGKRM
jgi:hypothetical protein